MPNKQNHGSVLLHLGLLSALAFAQPLYNLIGQNPEFLVAHNMTWLPVTGFVFLLSAGVPLLLFAIYRLVAAIKSKAGAATLFFLLWFLATLVFLPVSVKWLKLDGVWAMAAAFASGLLIASLYFRSTILRLFLSVFSFAALAFPLLFLFQSPASELLSGKAEKVGSAALTVSADNPVFILIFDEFPTLSILDSDANIDSGRFPVLAGLQQDAMWYRNHSANSNSTLIAIPALLSGNMPFAGQRGLPTSKNFPDNLFALLGRTYSVHAAEHATRLCPESVCGEQPDEFRLLLSDTLILFANIMTPPAWAGHLHPVNNDWKNFADQVNAELEPKSFRGFQKTLNWATRIRDFYSFIESITAEPKQLYYFHAMLPHASWKYLPDGRLIVADETGKILGSRENVPGMPFKHMWYDDVAAMQVNRQRHVLQTGLVDNMIGDFLDRLKSLGIYEDSLIVLTSDHGISFQPGSTRRNVYQGNLVEISAIPLLIKFPGNLPSGISGINSQAMDIVPTILDALGATGWRGYDGLSLLDSSADRPVTKTLHENSTQRITISATEHLNLLRQNAKLQASEYGEQDFASLYDAGDEHGLVGKHVSDLAQSKATSPIVKIDQADFYQRVNLTSGFIPLVVHGRFDTAPENLPSRRVAVSVNGTIRAVSSLLQIPGRLNEFELLLPPFAFTDGANRVEAWLVLESGNSVSLLRAESADQPGYRLISDPDGSLSLYFDGVVRAVEKGVIVGWSQVLSSETENVLQLAGWAADLENGIPAEQVVIFIDGEFYSSLVPERTSNSVGKRYDNPALDNCGFRIPVPISSPQHAEAMQVRIFALSIEKRVSELRYTKDAAYWPFKKNPRH